MVTPLEHTVRNENEKDKKRLRYILTDARFTADSKTHKEKNDRFENR
jgi:hypothetical protein